MPKPILRILIRTDKAKTGRRSFVIFAVRGWRSSKVEGWCPIEDHFEADTAWYRSRTRPATRAEALPILRRFRRLYSDNRVRIVRRLTRS